MRFWSNGQTLFLLAVDRFRSGNLVEEVGRQEPVGVVDVHGEVDQEIVAARATQDNDCVCIMKQPQMM